MWHNFRNLLAQQNGFMYCSTSITSQSWSAIQHWKGNFFSCGFLCSRQNHLHLKIKLEKEICGIKNQVKDMPKGGSAVLLSWEANSWVTAMCFCIFRRRFTWAQATSEWPSPVICIIHLNTLIFLCDQLRCGIWQLIPFIPSSTRRNLSPCLRRPNEKPQYHFSTSVTRKP